MRLAAFVGVVAGAGVVCGSVASAQAQHGLYGGGTVYATQYGQGRSAPRDASQAEYARREAELSALRSELSTAQERLRNRVRSLYRLQRGGLLPFATGLAGLVTHQARLHRLKRLVEADLTSISAFTKRERVLQQAVDELEASVTQAAVAMRPTMATSPGEPVAMSSEAFLQAFVATETAAAPTYNAPSGYGTLRVRDGRSVSGRAFAELRGYLDLPVARSAEVREGRREDGIGLELLAPAGTAARGVADGRVAFAGQYSSYGQLVIIDHGDNYFTVYGGLGTIGVSVGSHVMEGAELGRLGLDGPSQGLYFEVRRGTRALDAASWLGL